MYDEDWDNPPMWDHDESDLYNYTVHIVTGGFCLLIGIIIGVIL